MKFLVTLFAVDPKHDEPAHRLLQGARQHEHPTLCAVARRVWVQLVVGVTELLPHAEIRSCHWTPDLTQKHYELIDPILQQPFLSALYLCSQALRSISEGAIHIVRT